MSTISNSIYSLLTGNATLAALVDNRVFPVVAPSETALPYLVFQRISHVSAKAHDGSQLHNYRYQFTAVSTGQPETEEIREALIALLDGYDGTLDGERVTCWHDTDTDGHDDEAGFYSVNCDFLFTRQN